MKKTKKSVKGFTLLESVIALSLTAMAFAAAVASITVIANNRAKAVAGLFFINEAKNYIKCYDISGADGFEYNAERLMNVTCKTESGSRYVIYYDGAFNVLDEYTQNTSAAYEAVIELGGGFIMTVRRVSDKSEVFSMKNRYISSRDISGGGGAA